MAFSIQRWCPAHRLNPSCNRYSGGHLHRNPATSRVATMASPKEMLDVWLKLDTNASSRDQLSKLAAAEDWTQLSDLLCKRLEFGTAGLRGKMGPGFNRMNAITVQQTTQGLVRYLENQNQQQLREHGVAIGFDGRHHSKEFAHIAAGVVIKAGYKAELFHNMVPTPFVAAAVKYLNCAAGIMITASHNTKEYNGYKVYWGNGCQIIPPHDAGIAASIEANLDLWPLPHITTSTLLHDPTAPVTAAYAASQQQLCYRRHLNSSAPPLVYTPLHGVGLEAVRSTFARFGLPQPHVVPQQAAPDPDFPTVDFPNPEEGKGTWRLAFETADALGVQLVLANDPDADRLAAAEKDSSSGAWRPFSGNEIGILLADWLWTNFRQSHPDVPPDRVLMLASTVSSKMLSAMAAAEGFTFRESLTGFKWLSNVAEQLEAQQGLLPLFAFEEAIGYMAYPVVKDKDGVTAAAVFAEMAAALAARCSTVAQHLQQLYQRYGHYVYRSGYFIADRPADAQAVFARLRHGGQYPGSVAGVRVTAVRDLGTGLDTSQPGGKAVLPWVPGDMMITLYLEGGAVITVRASATEPKLKYYLEVVGSEAVQAAAVADRLQAAVGEELVVPELHGLRVPAHG